MGTSLSLCPGLMEVFREGVSSGQEMGGSELHPGEGWGLPAAPLFLWPLPPAVLDALGCARGQQDRPPPLRERELTWTKILFIAEDEQGRLVFRTLIG